MPTRSIGECEPGSRAVCNNASTYIYDVGEPETSFLFFILVLGDCTHRSCAKIIGSSAPYVQLGTIHSSCICRLGMIPRVQSCISWSLRLMLIATTGSPGSQGYHDSLPDRYVDRDRLLDFLRWRGGWRLIKCPLNKNATHDIMLTGSTSLHNRPMTSKYVYKVG